MAKKYLIYGVIAVVVIAGYFAFDWAMGAIIHNRKVVIVPDLVGKSVPDALALVSPMGLGLQKDSEQFDKMYPPGTIIRQDPPKDMTVREGRIIRVAVSQGGETLFVPDLLGQPLRNAQTLLQNSGLSIGEIDRKPSIRFEKDQVMNTDPPPKAVVSKGALVGLVVSDGPPGSDIQLMPDFIGRPVAEAKKWASSRNITVTVREESNLTRSPGEVLQQSPTADSPYREGDTLTIVVNSGSTTELPQGARRILYQLPEGTADRDVRVLVIDEAGEHEVYRKAQAPGSSIDLTYTPKGRARARIFMNGIMVEEQDLQ
jgi:beta-lactam-binding protein with PASTA domain